MKSKHLTEKQLEDNFQEMYKSLFWMSCDITNNSEATRDIIQECYSVLWDSHRDLPYEDVSAYIFTSVRNASLKWTREQHKISSMPINLLSDNCVIEKEEDWKEREVKVCEVEKYLRSLSPKAREMVKLRFIQNLSYKEIAELTDTNIETVRKTLYRSLKSIRNKINANNIQK